MNKATVELLAGTFLVALVLALSAGAYLWHQGKMGVPPIVTRTEQALADGTLHALIYADMRQMSDLHQSVFGEGGGAELPGLEGKEQLIEALYSGPVNFAETLDHLWIAVHGDPQTQIAGGPALILSGTFQPEALLKGLQPFYTVEALNRTAYRLRKKTAPVENASCPAGPDADPADRPEQYLILTGGTAIVTGKPAHGAHLADRLQSDLPAVQDLAQWDSYRSGRLVAAMVGDLSKAGRSAGGIPGKIVRQAAAKNTELTGIMAGVSLDAAQGGLTFNLTLLSGNGQWKQETAAYIRGQQSTLVQDTRQISPTLGHVLRRLSVTEDPQGLAVDLLLDAGMMAQIDQIISDTVGAVFGPTISVGEHGQGPVEQIDPAPQDYSVNSVFTTLPDAAPADHEFPLFTEGPFFITFGGLKKTDEGILELSLKGQVTLPKAQNMFGDGRTGTLSLTVDGLTDAEGRDLRRDERCVSAQLLFGQSRNHEPETTPSLFQDKAFVTKRIRLDPNAPFLDLKEVSGEISFTSPVSVHAVTLPLRAGETVEHKGLIFRLTRIGENSAAYQISGDTDRFLELRARNQRGQVLRRSWRLGSEGHFNQGYFGTIDSLELFIVDRLATYEATFTIPDLLAAPKDKPKQPPAPLAETIDPAAWKAFETAGRWALAEDPRPWQTISRKDRRFLNKDAVVGRETWRHLALFVSHIPQESWTSHPQARLYYPQIPALASVLSALSYRIETPAKDGGPADYYFEAQYPYNIRNGEPVVQHRLGDKPIAAQPFTMQTGLDSGERLSTFKGKLIVRLPTGLASETFDLDTVWDGQTAQDIKVTLTGLAGGGHPGFTFRVEGALDRFANLYGLDADGKRVKATTATFRPEGYWTLTLPFGRTVSQVELVYVTDREVEEYPFSIQAKYQD